MRELREDEIKDGVVVDAVVLVMGACSEVRRGVE